MASANGHSLIIKQIAEEMLPQVYVELGICGGVTFNAVLPSIREVAYACDIGQGVGRVIDSKHPKVKIFDNRSSMEFSRIWNESIKREIDLIFIDADHSRDAVILDAINFYPWLKEDSGLMVLHDTWPPDKLYTSKDRCGDCYRSVSILKKKLNGAEILTIPVQYGLTLIRKV